MKKFIMVCYIIYKVLNMKIYEEMMRKLFNDNGNLALSNTIANQFYKIAAAASFSLYQ